MLCFLFFEASPHILHQDSMLLGFPSSIIGAKAASLVLLFCFCRFHYIATWEGFRAVAGAFLC